ncbi:MAG TPA: DUF1761 domain-containing protein, partial [Anaerolineales bacterium]|nr:DUF1761 domain-containing protein [Anaerolineales bacterium]
GLVCGHGMVGLPPPRAGRPRAVRFNRINTKKADYRFMLGINYLAVVVAAVAAFVVSTVWYIVFGKEMMKLQGVKPDAMADMETPQPWKILVEIVRSLVVAYVLARFVVLLGVVEWMGAVQLGVWVWIGFPITLLVGSVVWENIPWKLAAIHAGDWLVKILFIVVILGVWR